MAVVYLFWPETARLSLEEVAHNFGDEVAVHVYDASEEEKKRLDQALQVSNAGEGVRIEI
jgi:hypothetical protein